MELKLQPDEEGQAGIRLNRFLAEAGVCSRRDADELIRRGEVTVNGQAAMLSAQRVIAERDAVKVAGRRIFAQPLVYVLLHKPLRVVSTLEDPQHRATVLDLLKGVRGRVVPVGRLDYNTSGVLLLTNDGELALRLTHPRYEIPKTYHAKVSGIPTAASVLKMARGVRVPAEGGRYEKTQPAQVHLLRRFRRESLLSIVIQEGRKHQVRLMCQAIGHPVVQLERVRMGFLTLAHLPPGRWRYLAKAEISRLRKLAGLEPS